MSGARKSGLIVFGAIFVLLFAGIAVAQGIGNPGVPDGDIALVEDVPDGKGEISMEQYERSFLQTWKRGGLQQAPKPGEAQFEQIKEAAINDLLDQAWLTGEAAELGVTATEREIDNEFQTIRQDQFPNEAAFDRFLEESSFTEEEVLDRVRLQVLSRKIEEQITQGVEEVPEEQIEEFYESSKENFTTPETRDIRLIVTDNKADADEVEAELEKSSETKDYARLAREFSTNGSSSQGGRTVATEGAFPDPAGSEVMGAEEGAETRSDRGRRRLLLLQGRQDQPGRDPDPRRRPPADPPAAAADPSAAGDERLRRRLQLQMDLEDLLRRGLHGRPLQQLRGRRKARERRSRLLRRWRRRRRSAPFLPGCGRPEGASGAGRRLARSVRARPGGADGLRVRSRPVIRRTPRQPEPVRSRRACRVASSRYRRSRSGHRGRGMSG